jgi:hypothetical protein
LRFYLFKGRCGMGRRRRDDVANPPKTDRNGLEGREWRFVQMVMEGRKRVRAIVAAQRVGGKEVLRWMMKPAFRRALRGAMRYVVFAHESDRELKRWVAESRVIVTLAEEKPAGLLTQRRERDAAEVAAEMKRLGEESEREWVRSIRGEAGVAAFDEMVKGEGENANAKMEDGR